MIAAETGSSHSLPRLLDSFPALADALTGLERAAATEAPLLLLGEPGSGRSRLARAVHAASPRGGGPLVEVDPGTIPPSLFESELFGHRPGAFTGADRAVEGRVARAGGGSLLFDHVEEIPHAVQPKLLRLVAEGRYQPLSGSERSADVRFLATAAEDLHDRVRRGLFREDLYFRLEVLAFRIPPLRQRQADLPALVADLASELAGRLGRAVPEVAENTLAWMAEYPWPGNLRELRNLLQREMILGREGTLAPEPPQGMTGTRPRSLAEVEADEIRRALAYTRGHQTRAAALLGISRKALWEKRKRYGIP